MHGAQAFGVVSRKKTIRAAEQDRPDVARRRSAWRRIQPTINPERLIFIDETWAKTTMTRLRGRAPRGQRLIDKTPHGHWQTTTLIGALGVSGMRCSTVVDGAVNGNVFEAFVEQVLVPELPIGRYGDTGQPIESQAPTRPRTDLRQGQASPQIPVLPNP